MSLQQAARLLACEIISETKTYLNSRECLRHRLYSLSRRYLDPAPGTLPSFPLTELEAADPKRLDLPICGAVIVFGSLRRMKHDLCRWLLLSETVAVLDTLGHG